MPRRRQILSSGSTEHPWKVGSAVAARMVATRRQGRKCGEANASGNRLASGGAALMETLRDASLWWDVLIIFSAQVVYVSMMTVRWILLLKGHRYPAAAISIIEVILWVYALGL